MCNSITVSQQELLETADLRQAVSYPYPDSGYIRIRTSDTHNFQNLTETFLSKDTSVIKFL